MKKHLRCIPSLVALFASIGCHDQSSSGVPSGTGADSGVAPGPDPADKISGGTAVDATLPEDALRTKTQLDQLLQQFDDTTNSSFENELKAEFSELSYDPAEAIGLGEIADSTLGLSSAERDAIERDGFMISATNSFPTFTDGFASIYGDHLPLYITTDSILHAMHRSYDEILKRLEAESLVPALTAYLSQLRSALQEADFAEQVHRDLDIYLTVAESLLLGRAGVSEKEAARDAARDLYDGCVRAEGVQDTELFGVVRNIDFSQCTPRGHYADSVELSQYFRAMMWLGRIDFRMLETQPGGKQLFHRRQLEAALALDELMGEEARSIHQQVDAVVTAFVGEHDYMTVGQLGQLKAALGVSSLLELESVSDQSIASTIVAGGYGLQRISSHYMVVGPEATDTLPLSASFALFGQRYVIDSHVFSNLVFDRVKSGTVLRMMPQPLDVAFAVLGNDQAGALLEDELATYDYAADLSKMRALVDQEDDAYWNLNLYNGWLGALRTLSPASAPSDSENQTLPGIFRTEAWGRRLLNTQLASWAELRHDTILYAKQSYTGGILCEFPDAYVDPYPHFYAAVQRYAEQGLGILDALAFQAPAEAEQHFELLYDVAGILGQMAENQLSGTPHSDDHMAFVNDAVSIELICGGGTADGWYPELIVGDPLEFDPTIADVHTQPTDGLGSLVGRVLHVGTGLAQLMVTTVETCEGPRAYAGVVSTYYERIEEDFVRLDDEKWKDLLYAEPMPRPAWMGSLVVPDPAAR